MSLGPLFDELAGNSFGDAVVGARARALELGALASGTGAAATFLAELLTRSLLHRPWEPPEVEGLLGRVVAAIGCDPGQLRCWTLLHAVRDPWLLSLVPSVAVESQLRLLVLLGGVSGASLWAPPSPGEPARMLVAAGTASATRAAREAAGAALGSGEPAGGPRALLRAVPVLRFEEPAAALVARVERTGMQPGPLLRECAGAIAPVLERDQLLAAGADRVRVVASAGEARLRVVGLDLHDGALQEVARLRGDLQLFRQQVAEALEGGRVADILVGRVDDLVARVVGIDEDLRALAASTQSPAVLGKPFPEVIDAELALHRTRSGNETELRFGGDLEQIGEAQRLALFRILQEALANIRQHSNADRVTVAVRVRGGSVRAAIVDDGVGFDVSQTLPDAARRGRLGLVGMSERAALMGGTLRIDSALGGPTRVDVVLPLARPAAQPQA